MPTWSWIVIAVIVIIAIVLAVMLVSANRRKRSEGLRERFGPEYERAVGEHGDQRVAEKELAARERRRSKLDIVALSPEARVRYAEEWRAVQTSFVDNPSEAVGRADHLVTQVMRERGYPVDDFDERAADISVDHPDLVEHYRAGHSLHLAQRHGNIGTEAQREAFVHYRALFEKLLDTDGDTRSRETGMDPRAQGAGVDPRTQADPRTQGAGVDPRTQADPRTQGAGVDPRRQVDPRTQGAGADPQSPRTTDPREMRRGA